MEIHKVLSALLALSCAQGAPTDDYFLPQQGFYYSYQLQPRSNYFYPSAISKPEFYPELGMSPQYHDVVYDYVRDFAGTQAAPHAQTFQPFIYDGSQSGTQGNAPEGLPPPNEGLPTPDNDHNPDQGAKQHFHHKPNLNNYFLPSDFFSLPNHPQSDYIGRLDAIKTNSVSPKARPTSLPPIGGVISNYILSRDHKAEPDLQHMKRQTPDTDGVVILAEPPQSSKETKAGEEAKGEVEGEGEGEGEKGKEEEEVAAHPGIAQSKPSAIALAGPGGMAQASPVGTALVGQGGLAVAAPSGTAVAGPAGGSIPIHIGGEKQRKETTEKSEESDGF